MMMLSQRNGKYSGRSVTFVILLTITLMSGTHLLLQKRTSKVLKTHLATVKKNNNFTKNNREQQLQVALSGLPFKDTTIAPHPRTNSTSSVSRNPVATSNSKEANELLDNVSTTKGINETRRRERAADDSLLEWAACKQLINNPKPFNFQHCPKRNKTSQQCRGQNATMVAQFEQDYYLYMTHFRHLRGRCGVYLDIAANDPVFISNTWFLDRCLNWSGVCVEANPRYVRELRSRRGCDIVPSCLGDKEGQRVSFIMALGLGGIKETNKNNKQLLYSKNINQGSMTMTCTTVKTELNKRNISKIDYLSLDVEGHELNVLKGIDWNAVNISVITIEIESKDMERNIARFLGDKGYYIKEVPRKRTATEPYAMLGDYLFVHNDVEWGSPK